MKKYRELSLLTLPVSVVMLFSCASQAGKDPAGEGAAAPTQASNAVAYVGDEPITAEELDKALAGQMMKIRQQEYELRRQVIHQLALQRIVDKEAAARGITVDDLFRVEVQEKVPKPSEQAVSALYQERKDQPPVQGKSEEEGKNLIRQQLEQQALSRRQDEYLRGLLEQAGLKILIEPPRVEVKIPDGEPTIGPRDAPVTIVEFADFQCGYCKRVEPTLARLREEYKEKLQFVYRDYPLNFHKRAEPAAAAARCAGDQGKYWEFHRNLMTVAGNLEDDDLRKRATDMGLDMAAFTGCFESNRHAERVRAGLEDGSRLGVTGTPTFFINGRMIVGAADYADLKQVIDEELGRSQVKTQ
jgi:protein-disulfide isomerase